MADPGLVIVNPLPPLRPKLIFCAKVERAKIRQAGRAIAIWVWKDLLKPKLGLAAAAVLPTLTLWISKGRAFLWSSYPLPGWAISVLSTGTVLGLWWAIACVTALQKRPRWHTWNGVDFQLLPAFFEKSFRVQPEVEPDLWRYVKGPYCGNPRCRREMEVLDISAQQEFAHVAIRCQCNNSPVTIPLGRVVCGITPLRALLTEAIRDGEAAVRRGERFRPAQ